MNDYEEISTDDLPLVAPVQAIGGGVQIGPNSNLETDEDVVTVELVAYVPSPDGPTLGLLPVLMTPDVWNMLVFEATTTKENNESR